MSTTKQKGFSLVEVMVAVVISSILILGVTDLFNSSFMSGRSNTEVARMQESGRLALEIIGADAHRAGLWSCATRNWQDDPLPDPVAINSTGTSITFSYVNSTDCLSATAQNRAPRTITYAFNNNALTQATDGGGAQELLENVNGTFTLLPDAGDPASANAVRISISVAGDNPDFAARTFAATYEFKNKLIERN